MWEKLTDQGGATLEIDRSSITPTPAGTQKALVRLAYSGIQTDARGNSWDQGVLIVELDCPGRRMRTIDVVSYLRAERIEPLRTAEDWRPATPEKNAIFRRVCG